MNCCKNCKLRYEIEKVVPFPGGHQHIWLDGWVCVKETEEHKALWYSGYDEEEFCCDKFIPIDNAAED